MSRTKRLLALVMAVLVACAVSACGGSTGTKAEHSLSTPAGPPAATITIDNFTFDSPPSVPAGASIAVKNSDPAEHSVTADSGSAFNVEVEAGETATFTAPSAPGSYPYHCSYHPTMHGTLVVT